MDLSARDLENQNDGCSIDQLQKYISAVQNTALERAHSIEDESLKSWLEWAVNYAKSFDPLFTYV